MRGAVDAVRMRNWDLRTKCLSGSLKVKDRRSGVGGRIIVKRI
jgi:hypothetical protein